GVTGGDEAADRVGAVETYRDRLAALRDGARDRADKLRRLHELFVDQGRARVDVGGRDLALVDRQQVLVGGGLDLARRDRIPRELRLRVQLVGQDRVEHGAASDLLLRD